MIKILLLLILISLLIFLQIIFAKKNLWISLILPSIFFIIGIYLTVKSPYLFTKTKWSRLSIFVATNIPTAIFIAIYYGFKSDTSIKK